MHVLRSTLFLVLAAFATLALLGCEVEDDPTDVTDTADTTEDTTPDTEPDVTPDPYRYVRILDQSAVATTPDGGADVDAVVLQKAGTGELSYATEVIAFTHGGGLGTELNPTDALFAPDAFTVWQDTTEPQCSLEAGFVSLGGLGGELIVDMGAETQIEAGDTLTVLEVGGCTGNDGAAGIVEEVQVDIAIASGADAQWVTLGTGAGPVANFPVPAL